MFLLFCSFYFRFSTKVTILNKTDKNEKLCCRESNEARITKALGLHKNFVFCFVLCSFIRTFAKNMVCHDDEMTLGSGSFSGISQ